MENDKDCIIKFADWIGDWGYIKINDLWYLEYESKTNLIGTTKQLYAFYLETL